MAGVQQFILHLLDGLDRSKYEIHVATRTGGEFDAQLRLRNVPIHPLPCLRREISLWDFIALIHLCLIMRRHRFDIVHTNSSKPGFLGRIAASICKIPKVLHSCHGTPFNVTQPPTMRRFYMLLEWFANRLCHQVIFVNHADRLLYIRKNILPAHKAMTIYNALSPAKQKQLEEIAKHRVYPEQGMITIGSSLRFSEPKNIIEVVIRACNACKVNEFLRFVFVGDGEHLDLCRTIVGTNKLNERILFPGWDNDIFSWLKRMDLFVLYSVSEALPICVIEALFAGLPVIGSAIDGIKELVDEDCGYLVPVTSPIELEELFISLTERRAEIRKKSLAASSTIGLKCSYERMISSYQMVYDGYLY